MTRSGGSDRFLLNATPVLQQKWRGDSMRMRVEDQLAAKRSPELDHVDQLYFSIVKRLIDGKVIEPSMRILVTCGGLTDRDTLQRVGLTNFVISNVDSRHNAEQFQPIEWSFQDAEALTYADDSFDFCIEHEGLHHCKSPHRAIGEMYRVAKRGILLVEPSDSLLTSLGTKMGIGQDYEHAAVFANDCRFGGVRNSPIPNFIYRFTEGEIRKMLLCLDPTLKLDFRFEHHLKVPWGQLQTRKSGFKLAFVRCAQPMLFAAHALMPKVFGNQIAAVALKPKANGLHPWLVRRGNEVAVNEEWLSSKYVERALKH
jgi:SAM-dependent methyltransferase